MRDAPRWIDYVSGDTVSGALSASKGTVRIVSRGRNLLVSGNRIGNRLPECTGGDRFTDTVVGQSKPMLTPGRCDATSPARRSR